jgi:hypothetical protein
MTVPQWMIETIQEARDLYGVGGAEWNITVSVSDKPGGKSDASGYAKTDSIYKNAHIELSCDLKDDEDGRQIIHHEIFHVAHSEVKDMVNHMIDNVDEDKQEFFIGLFDNVCERMVQTVTRSICFKVENKNDIDG